MPLSRTISREMMPMTVDFPAPLGPIMEITLPLGMWKVTSSTTVFPSYCFERFLMIIGQVLLLVKSR